jgi:hypothetical protein
MPELRSRESVRCSAVKVSLGLSQQKGGYDIFVFSCFVFVLVGRGRGGAFIKPDVSAHGAGIYCWNLVAFL